MNASLPWPRIGLGCASLGAPSMADADAEAVMVAAIDAGIRFFDAAPLYGGGLAEERLGRALTGLPRESYVLCTKTGVTRPYAQPPMPAGAIRPRQFDVWDYSAQATRTSAARSLERLRTSYLDVVHLHDVEDHLDACLEAHAELERLRREGLVRNIGIGSNLVAPVQHLIERAPFSAFLLAGRYTLLDQTGRTLIAEASARGIRVVGGGVFNSGVLGAWPQPAPTFGYEPAPATVVARTAEIAAICARHATPLAAAALQFVVAQPAIATVVIGPRTVEELRSNLSALEHDIPDRLWDDLESSGVIAPGSPRPRRNVTAVA